MKKWIKWLFFVFALAFVSFAIWRIVDINIKYPRSEKVQIPAGTEMDYQGVKFKVTAAEWVDVSALPDEDEMKVAVYSIFNHPKETRTRAMILEYEFYNPGKEAVMVDMTTTNIEAGNYSSPMEKGTVNFFDSTGGCYVNLEAGETRKCKVLHPFYDTYFTDREWETLTQRQFYFVTKLYPVKQMALIPAEPLS